MAALDADDLAFAAAPKVLLRNRIRWWSKGHRDYVEARLEVAARDQPGMRGRIVLTAHKTRSPPKWGYALLYRGVRVFGLDVNPGHGHINIMTMRVRSGTHWQSGPHMDAVPDTRDLFHRQWLDEFLRRINVSAIAYRYKAPPSGGEQLVLAL